jgi:hypothetical protein
MNSDRELLQHYSRGALLSRLKAALAGDGVDPERPSLEALAPYDHFHTRGLEATAEMGELIEAGAGHHFLDIGSGMGLQAREWSRSRC